jgi:hypothetical protein
LTLKVLLRALLRDREHLQADFHQIFTLWCARGGAASSASHPCARRVLLHADAPRINPRSHGPPLNPQLTGASPGHTAPPWAAATRTVTARRRSAAGGRSARRRRSDARKMCAGGCDPCARCCWISFPCTLFPHPHHHLPRLPAALCWRWVVAAAAATPLPLRWLAASLTPRSPR